MTLPAWTKTAAKAVAAGAGALVALSATVTAVTADGVLDPAESGALAVAVVTAVSTVYAVFKARNQPKS